MFKVISSRKMPNAARVVMGIALMLCAVSTSTSAAADTPAWYATGSLGFTSQSDQKLVFTPPGTSTATTSTLPLDTGFLSGASIGRYLSDDWRIEAEFMYQSVEHPTSTLATGGPTGDGNYASTTVALNALREFNLFGKPSTRTYAGLGAVYATEVDVDFESGGVEKSFSGSGTGLQALFGARYSLGERAFVDAAVRYLIVSNVDLDGEEGTVGRIKADYEPLAVTVSFGWRF